MMDAKYLAEIEARCEGDVPDIAAPVFRDRKALIAEVERLTDIEKEYHHYRRLSEKLDQQIATLKRAMELMSETACGEVPGIMPEWDMIGCVPDKRCMKENPCKGSDNQCHECWTRYFIQQAQAQQTQEQEGKK